ncbi:phosphotransferase enzyme family protein [Pedobacter sandarakinus]|uniref:phosphotransferase enzyme family protein n=1 Tax=Pedobacter sandarakinus TaxID=353156 RepID=UPI00224774B1|nr:aminoglycoside phosphotransferase family protein [Pedobacter sandarakinus]MCX2573140.1 aminoglycoside phosphotransferase family protein [Pedobacter sandarakinus]
MGLNFDYEVLKAYGYHPDIHISQIGSGLINRTFLLSQPAKPSAHILQQINTDVFKNPEAIAKNIKAIGNFLSLKYPDYLFIKPINTVDGSDMAIVNGAYWRVLPFIPDTTSLDVLTEPKQAYEAAKQFGKLSRLLDGFPVEELTPTIPHFHDLNLRFDQFTQAFYKTTDALKDLAAAEIGLAFANRPILDYYNTRAQSAAFPDRVMHHDTKISNVLLHHDGFEGVCVIDLDTIMPGKFISDLGDMMRTYLCACNENETDLKKIKIRLPYFEATMKGYLSEMKNILTETEKELILFSGKYMIYMQALRFLTDYLNGDIYYPIKYESQNLDRAKNQFKLLHELFYSEQSLQEIIDRNLT